MLDAFFSNPSPFEFFHEGPRLQLDNESDRQPASATLPAEIGTDREKPAVAIIHPRFRAREERKKLTIENVIPKIADCNRDCARTHTHTL
jgi:hypothetical protein